MVIKVIIGTLILALGLVFGFQRYKSSQELIDAMRRGRLATAVERAKASGKREIKLDAPVGYYAAVPNLADALSHYTTVLAEPINESTQLSSDGQQIETWYKFKAEFLSKPKINGCDLCPSAQNMPAKFQPLQQDELVLKRYIGSIMIDGVTVTVNDDDFPVFKRGEQYFMFVKLNPTMGVASLELGPEAVSVIDANGRFSPFSPKHQISSRHLTEKYIDSKSAKAALHNRRFPE